MGNKVVVVCVLRILFVRSILFGCFIDSPTVALFPFVILGEQVRLTFLVYAMPLATRLLQPGLWVCLSGFSSGPLSGG